MDNGKIPLFVGGSSFFLPLPMFYRNMKEIKTHLKEKKITIFFLLGRLVRVKILHIGGSNQVSLFLSSTLQQ